MRTCRMAVIPGDGIGPEVVQEGIRVIETAIQAVFADPIFPTQDLGGKATTKEAGRAVVAALPPVYNGRRR